MRGKDEGFSVSWRRVLYGLAVACALPFMLLAVPGILATRRLEAWRGRVSGSKRAPPGFGKVQPAPREPRPKLAEDRTGLGNAFGLWLSNLTGAYVGRMEESGAVDLPPGFFRWPGTYLGILAEFRDQSRRAGWPAGERDVEDGVREVYRRLGVGRCGFGPRLRVKEDFRDHGFAMTGIPVRWEERGVLAEAVVWGWMKPERAEGKGGEHGR